MGSSGTDWARATEAGQSTRPACGGVELILDWDTLTANTDPDQNLTVWAAPASLRQLTEGGRCGPAAQLFCSGFRAVSPAGTARSMAL
ncbi:hypothetical protein GCM10010317_101860 [Streptomyces mirabilis]|nr:hypothetical protein GCM10010317_101860 [Streptomyces mirabilis]